MTDQRWRQIEALFVQAVECPAAERPTFLDQVCGGDEDLRRELESLLACDAPEQELMDVPIVSAADLMGDSSVDLAGKRVGPYRLVRLLGHGGMGSVYLGVRDDDQYKKQVAIKLLKRGMDTDFMLSRFRQERQILANLEYPFIARLLDGGATEDGLPYLVMEYVDGVPITKYCAGKDLTIPERLRLFQLVCEAVQHAHQNLVVHRDIKPSNILTTKEGIPKLLDFGIAKVIDPASSMGVTLTRPEFRMLTPDYASPEQVKCLPISTASDIYSLGTVLYELLTGQRPHRFESGSVTDLERAICEVDPEKPSLAVAQNSEHSPGVRKQLSRQLAGDLDNIILAAMRKEPQRRYASAAEFSEDLRRHMEALPILAQEDRWTYRAAKFIRRHRLGVLVATLFVATLIGGIVATTVQARRAERRFQLVRGLANSMLFEIHNEVQQLPGSTKARASMIQTVLRYLDNLAKDAGQDSGLQIEIAKAYRRIAAIERHPFHANLGQTASARAHYQKALSMLTVLSSQAETRAAATEERIGVSIELGDIEQAAGNLEAAKALFRSAAAPVDSVALSPNSQMYVYLRLGDIEAQEGVAATAAEHFRKGLEHAQAWLESTGSIDARRDLQAAYRRLANAARESGDLFTCRDNLRKAQEVIQGTIRQTNRNVEDRRNLWTTHVVLADVLGGPDDLNMGDYAAAIAHYRAAAALSEEMVAEDRHDVRVRRDLAISYRRLGRMLFEDAPAQALQYHVKALEVVESLRAMDPANIDFRRDVAEVNLGLATLLRKAGRNGDAMAKLTHALELQQSIEAMAPSRIWVVRYITQIHTEIGNTAMATGNRPMALNSYHEALQAAERLLKRAPTSLYLERDRGDVLEALGRYHLAMSAQQNLTRSHRMQMKAEARSCFQKSLSIWQDWTNKKLAAPYAGRRQSQAVALIAAADKR